MKTAVRIGLGGCVQRGRLCEGNGARHGGGSLLGPAAGELLTDAEGPAPGRHDLHPPLPHLAERKLTLYAGLVELGENASDRLGRGGMAEGVCDRQAPVPVVAGVRLGVAGAQDHGGLHVALLVGNPQVELEVGPVARERVDDLRKCVGEGHRGSLGS
jgi:hypothetical protein